MVSDYHMLLLKDNRPLMIAGAASATLLTAALLFEHVGGLVPCDLCLTQRVPHYAIVSLTLLSLIRPYQQKTWRPVATLFAATTAGVGLQHVGVEQGWWQGPTGCSSSLDATASLSDLTASLLATPVVRCDEIAWSLFGISMAGWNMLISLALALFLFWATLEIFGLVRTAKDKEVG